MQPHAALILQTASLLESQEELSEEQLLTLWGETPRQSIK